jgi:entericidin B
MRIFKSLLISLGLIATITACNTVEGVGKDIKSSGEAIEKAGK